jgi:hypothetical protein
VPFGLSISNVINKKLPNEIYFMIFGRWDFYITSFGVLLSTK